MKQSRQMGILEGLHQQRVDEGSSNFSSKLTSFLKDTSSDDAAFIKKALNSLYLGFGKEFGGYIEGKRPIIKDKNTYSYMTWKIQTNQSTHYGFYNLVAKYWKPLGHKTMDIEIDGTRYYSIVKGVTEDADTVFMASQFRKNFSLDSSIVIGIYSASYKNEKVDPNGEGDTFKLVVSVPNLSYAIVDNPDVEKTGMQYYFKCKDGTIHYDAGSNEFTTMSSSGLRCCYKKSRNAEKAFQELYAEFSKSMTLAKAESFIDKYKVPLSTSYYPDLI